MQSGHRESELRQWLEITLPLTGVQPAPGSELELSQLRGDAGFRRYYRCGTRPACLAVDAPTDTENSEAFIAIARYLRSQGVATPEVHAADLERGFLLLEDFGDQLLHLQLNAENVDALYVSAMKILLQFQRCTANQLPVAERDTIFHLPDYDSARLGDEMALFHQWFATELLGVQLSAEDYRVLDTVYRQLEDSALRQPQVFVHRDFHSRNLMWLDGGALGVIDFQDAVRGPLTYDLVSLLRDCYLRWPPQRVDSWIEQYRQWCVESGALPSLVDRVLFRRWVDWMGLQRHIKVLGIFARLWLRDSKPGYLNDLPLVIHYTLEVAEHYAEFGAFVRLFRERLLPVCARQPWFRDLSPTASRVP